MSCFSFMCPVAFQYFTSEYVHKDSGLQTRSNYIWSTMGKACQVNGFMAINDFWLFMVHMCKKCGTTHLQGCCFFNLLTHIFWNYSSISWKTTQPHSMQTACKMSYLLQKQTLNLRLLYTNTHLFEELVTTRMHQMISHKCVKLHVKNRKHLCLACEVYRSLS